jgi:hypothetical protein
LRKDSTDSNTSSKEASIRYLETLESSVLRAPVTSCSLSATATATPLDPPFYLKNCTAVSMEVRVIFLR